MISVWSDYGGVIARHPRSETLNEASKLHHRPCGSCNERERGQEPERRFGFGRQFESNRRESCYTHCPSLNAGRPEEGFVSCSCS